MTDKSTTPTRGAGRPPTAAANRTRRFMIRLTDAEYADLRRRGYRAGVPMHTLIMRALGYEETPPGSRT
jgi:hypothetical protein